jgi:chitinase
MRFGRLCKVVLCLSLSMLATRLAHAGGIEPHSIVVYHDSWNEGAARSAADMSLAKLPGYISVVDLAFAKPDLVYPGKLDLSRTGLEYRNSGDTLRNAIAFLKARRPDAKVLISVGGAIYTNWDRLDEKAIVRLVNDLHADGVDIDFEPPHPGCSLARDQTLRCNTDPVWQTLVQRFRAVLPRAAILTAAVWSVGAFGEGEFKDAQPRSRYTGLMLHFLRSPMAAQLDMLSINAYDTGPDFDPMEAFRAYRALWPGMLALGVAVARDGGSGPFYSPDEAELLARQVAHDPQGAMTIYPLLANPDGARSDNLPDGRGLAKAICRGMGLTGCNAR